MSTINHFGISVFKEPEEFIAVYLGKNSQVGKFKDFVQKVLHRTKSPPLAVTYTYHFLKDKSDEELSLDVIRFVSQLADVSPGVSMSSSLQGILSESYFLTELRHSLTHKTMVKGSILSLSRKLILDELEQKYWKIVFEKLQTTYKLNLDLVNQYFVEIYGNSYDGDLSVLVRYYPFEFFKNCTNYEYKEHIVTVMEEFRLCRMSGGQFMRYFEDVSEQKQIIFMVILLQIYIEGQVQIQHFSSFVYKIVHKVSEQFLKNDLVWKQLLKVSFVSYLNQARKLYDHLPNKIKQEIMQFWRQKGSQIGHKLYKFQ